jgi:hypothetical protein
METIINSKTKYNPDWAPRAGFDCCVKCKTSDIKYAGHGLCRLCYSKSEYFRKSLYKYFASAKGKRAKSRVYYKSKDKKQKKTL